jgi:hypothetical protein
VLLALQVGDEMVHTPEAFALDPTRAQVDGAEVLGGGHGIVFLVLVAGEVTKTIECLEWRAVVADVLVEGGKKLRIDGVPRGIGYIVPGQMRYRGMYRRVVLRLCSYIIRASTSQWPRSAM